MRARFEILGGTSSTAMSLPANNLQRYVEAFELLSIRSTISTELKKMTEDVLTDVDNKLADVLHKVSTAITAAIHDAVTTILHHQHVQLIRDGVGPFKGRVSQRSCEHEMND